MLQARINEFTQKNGRRKRIAKHLCVTNVTGLLVACFWWKLHLTLTFSGPLQKDLFKGKWSLAKSYFEQNDCHTRFAVFFPLLRPAFFSGELLFFSFYCEGVWGWCLMPLGEPGPVTPLFAVPFFPSSTFRLVWVGATHRVVMVTFQAHLWRLSVSPCTFPTPIYRRWVNVAKCYLGSGLHH